MSILVRWFRILFPRRVIEPSIPGDEKIAKRVVYGGWIQPSPGVLDWSKPWYPSAVQAPTSAQRRVALRMASRMLVRSFQAAQAGRPNRAILLLRMESYWSMRAGSDKSGRPRVVYEYS